jgi:DNA-3-methyladenine glycosylase
MPTLRGSRAAGSDVVSGGRVLPREFYERPTLTVAQELLGKVLVHRTAEGIAAGMIVEAEAYIGEDDPACHAAPGPTRRNEPLYGPPGIAYVYLNYGIHCLVNAVTESEGAPAAVLIRALEPTEGIPLMTKRRSASGRAVPVIDLCRGPGNLTQALGITLSANRLDLCSGPEQSRPRASTQPALSGHTTGTGQAQSKLYIEDRKFDVHKVAWGPRVGIRVAVDRPWRCWIADNPSVSGPRRRACPLH